MLFLRWKTQELSGASPLDHMENLVQLRFHSYNLLKTAQKD